MCSKNSLQGAGEADLCLHRLHLAVEARDFAEADRVDLAGREVGRRADLDEVAVKRRRRPSCAADRRVSRARGK